jgi:hypothetical protein
MSLKTHKTCLVEAKEEVKLRALPHDCKKCGQSSEYARIYGCPAGFEDCPHDKQRRKPENQIPKSGLAGIMRDWMKSRTGTKAQRRFTIQHICNALTVTTAKQHQTVANALSDFEKRGEVESRLNKKHNRRHFYYVLDWRKILKGKINKKIFKAMYVSLAFAITDLQRLTGITERNWFDKLIHRLIKDGYIQQINRRHCAHGAGAENVYQITDRDKFKMEMMK